MKAVAHRSHRSRRAKTAGRWCLAASRCLVAATLVVTPLFWGGRHALSAGGMAVAVAAALGLWALGRFLRGRWAPVAASGLWLYGLVAAVLTLQLVPAVFDVLGAVVSPALVALWESARHVSSVGPATFAVRPEAQVMGLLAVASAAGVYWLGLQGFSRHERCLWLVGVIATAGTVSAVAGLVQVFGGDDWFFWLYKGAEKAASAGFPNRDHFAQFGVMGFFAALGLAAALRTASHGTRLYRVGKGRPWLAIGFAIAAVAQLLAIIFSYSRAAILVTVAGIVLFAVGLWMAHGRRSFSIPVAVVALALFIASFYGLDIVTERVAFVLSGTDPSALVRREIWQTVLDVIGLSPWVGSGWDGVLALAALFDTSYVPGVLVNAAHNDYLELLVMIGLPAGAVVLLAGVTAYACVAWRVVKLAKRHSSFFPLALGLLAGITAVLGHEAVEYGLKQPANLLLFSATVAALALVLKTAETTSEAMQSDDEAPQPGLRVSGFGALAVTVAVAVVLGWFGWDKACEGEAQVTVDVASVSAETNDMLPRRLVQTARLEAAQRVLSQWPKTASL